MVKAFINIFISIIVFLFGFAVVFGLWQSAEINTTDGDIYAGGDDSVLTINKWNALVNSIFTKKVKSIYCGRYVANAGATQQWKDVVWTSSDCGGKPIPSSYDVCVSARATTDGHGVNRGLHGCDPVKGQIYKDSTTSHEISIVCSYLCRNN